MPEKFPDIPGHRIIKEEGKGSAGKVFRGRSDKNGKLVAIKQISRSLTSHESFLGHLKGGKIDPPSGGANQTLFPPFHVHRLLSP